jgi:hypothetical protein
MIVWPVRPGQSEAWRRFVQELQGTRREEFGAACRRWGIRSLAVWLAPSRPNDFVVAETECDNSVIVFTQDLFDQWFVTRIRELHGVDLSTGIVMYPAELFCRWPERAVALLGGTEG